jgi:hypothetical protein
MAKLMDTFLLPFVPECAEKTKWKQTDVEQLINFSVFLIFYLACTVIWNYIMPVKYGSSTSQPNECELLQQLACFPI